MSIQPTIVRFHSHCSSGTPRSPARRRRWPTRWDSVSAPDETSLPQGTYRTPVGRLRKGHTGRLRLQFRDGAMTMIPHWRSARPHPPGPASSAGVRAGVGYPSAGTARRRLSADLALTFSAIGERLGLPRPPRCSARGPNPLTVAWPHRRRVTAPPVGAIDKDGPHACQAPHSCDRDRRRAGHVDAGPIRGRFRTGRPCRIEHCRIEHCRVEHSRVEHCRVEHCRVGGQPAGGWAGAVGDQPAG